MDNLNILSWNVRGLNSRARCDDTRLLVEDCRASIVCLQETKLDVVTNAFMLRLLGVQFTDLAYLLPLAREPPPSPTYTSAVSR